MKKIFILLGIIAFHTFSSAQTKPNIVVILADDLGYGSVNIYGAPDSLIRTPHINRLAEEGMRFTDANTPGSVCSPTRYALLTGRYAWRGRLKYGVLNPPEGALLIEEDLMTLPSYLQDQGYKTAHIGKWHLGYTNMENVDDLSAQPLTPGPRSIGFDYHFAVPNNIDWLPKVYIENEGIWGLRSKGKAPYGRSSYKNQLYHGYDAPQRVTTKVTGDLNDKAREWIFEQVREYNDQPFFLYFAPVAIHNPVTPAEDLRGSSNCGSYCDYIHDLDHSVGEIVDALAYAGVLDNTLIIFTSDNGGDIGQPEESFAREKGLQNNGKFRGDKHTIWEGGFRVPFVVRYPELVEAGTVSDRMINIVDIFATIQEITSGSVLPAGEAASDSFTFYDELIGKRNQASLRPSMITNSVTGIVALRTGPWKYIEGVASREMNDHLNKYFAKELKEQLINLEKDVLESKNLLTEEKKKVEELKKLLKEIRESGSERLAYSR
jgi:arylsulfatase A